MKEVTTEHGVYKLRRNVVGFSLYRAQRSLIIKGRRVKVGDVFEVEHRKEETLRTKRPAFLYGGKYVGTYNCDGQLIVWNAPIRDGGRVTKISGQLEVHHKRGVIYFHADYSGSTVLRICSLGEIADDFTSIDLTHLVGLSVVSGS